MRNPTPVFLILVATVARVAYGDEKPATTAACIVKTHADLERCDRQDSEVIGRYEAVAAPRKKEPHGKTNDERSKDRAVVRLDDGTEVFLEPMNSPRAKRTQEERKRFLLKRVRVKGTAYRTMPDFDLQSLIAPCISDVTAIELLENR
jgi:hypothetical protein